MILKKFDQEIIIKKQICLFHGKNDGQKELVLNNLKEKFNNNLKIYYERDIINNSDIFYNEIYSKSFFEKHLMVKILQINFKNIQYIIIEKLKILLSY